MKCTDKVKYRSHVMQRGGIKKKGIQSICFTAAAVFIFSSACFFDLIITTRHGINFWNALYEGEILKYYTYNLDAHCKYEGISYAMYNIIEYIIFAIWDFPLWIIEKTAHIDVLETSAGLMYAKSIVVFFFCKTLRKMKQICREIEMSETRIKRVLGLFLTSAICYVTVYSMGQYDIIMLFFVVQGVLAYLRRDRKAFYVNFMIAIPLKLFALLVFVPLLLLNTKKLIRILLSTVIVMFPYIVTTCLYLLTDPDGIAVAGTGQSALLRLMIANNIDLTLEPVSFFIMGMVFICMVCYIFRLPKKQEKEWTIYIVCMIFMVLSIAMLVHPQWLMYMVPFMCIMIGMQENFEIFLIIDTVGTFCIMLASYIYNSAICSANIIDAMWLADIFGGVKNISGNLSLFSILAETGAMEPINLIYKCALAVFVVCFIALGVLLCPWSTKIKAHLYQLSDGSEKCWMRIRLALSVGLCFIPIVSYWIVLIMEKD
ncbi:MAG: hypothetical protein NC337_02925 [Roseburia sp.]|nr:hypothetical protein [Roseburia sp.]